MWETRLFPFTCFLPQLKDTKSGERLGDIFWNRMRDITYLLSFFFYTHKLAYFHKFRLVWVIIGVGNVLLQCSAINFLSISYPNGNISFMANLHCKQIYFLVHTTSSCFHQLTRHNISHTHSPITPRADLNLIWFMIIFDIEQSSFFALSFLFVERGKLIFHEAQIYSHTIFGCTIRRVFAQILFPLKRFSFNFSQTHPRKLFAFASNSGLFMDVSHEVLFFSPHAFR